MVDEFGGIDGLVTMNDIVEDIVGNIDDEYDLIDDPQIIEGEDGNVVADALLELEEFTEKFGYEFDEEDLDDTNTVSGLIMSVAGRVPARGEVILHEKSGMEFEVLDSDLRRISRVRIKNIPVLENSE